MDRSLFCFTWVLILSLVVCQTSAAIYPASLLLPFSGKYSSTRHIQWLSTAKLAAVEINTAWAANSHQFQLGVFDTKSSGPETSSLALQAQANGSLVILGTGNDDLTNIASIVLENNKMAIVNPLASSKINSDVSGLLTTAPALSAPATAIQAILDRYSWSKIGIIYSPDASSTAIAQQLISNTQNNVAYSAAITPGGNLESRRELLKPFVRLSINIIIYVTADFNDLTSTLTAGTLLDLFGRGRSWIISNLPSQAIPLIPFPEGVLLVDPVIGPTSSLVSFTTKLKSQNPATYPGLGPSMTLDPVSIYVYDSVIAIASSIQSLWSGTVSQSTLLTKLKSTTFTGVSGTYAFSASGARDRQVFTISNRKNGTITLAHTFDGTTLSVNLTEISFPGTTPDIPDDQIDYLPIGFIAPISTLTSPMPPSAPTGPSQGEGSIASVGAGALSVFRLGIDTANQLMPSGYKIAAVGFDDQNSPSVATQLGFQFSGYGIIGIIGTLGSATSIALQNVIQASSLPQLSPSATSFTLSDKSLYPTFLRNIPPDPVQAAAMLQVIFHYGWEEVGVISSDSAPNADLVLKSLFAGRVRIIKQSTIIADNWEDVIDDMRSSGTKVVVVIAGNDATFGLMATARKMGYKPSVWLLSSTATGRLEFPSLVTNGARVSDFNGVISILPSTGYGKTRDDYIEYVAAADPKLYPNATTAATTAALPYAYDTPFIFVDAISRVIADGKNPRNGSILLEYLRSTNISLVTGSTSFDENGDRIGPYDIINIVDSQIVQIGYWTPDKPGVEMTRRALFPDGTTNIPSSKIDVTREWLEWKSGAGIVFSVLAGLGILVSVIMIIVLIIYKEAPVIKGATPEFLVVMLLGTSLGFGSVYTWIGEPHPWICALRIWLPPMAFAIIFAPLLTKTWRLHRIFTLGSLKTTPISLKRLVVYASVVVGIQLVLCIFWISLGTIQTQDVMDSTNSLNYFVKCRQNSNNRIISYITFGYFGFLLLVGAYLAFRVRNLPKNFNESKWLGFSIYNILLWSTLMLILGFSLNKFPITVAILICVATLTISGGSVALMFAPKLWQLIRNPEERSSKVKGGSGTQNSAKSVSKSSSFLKGGGSQSYN